MSRQRREHSTEKVVAGVFPLINKNRRAAMIATTGNDIKDWEIKVKIGGFGIMTQLMGKSLES